MGNGEVSLWLVGQVNLENHKEWEVQGVFSTEAKAVAACVDESYFVGPLVLDEAVPDESVEWRGAYYPKTGGDYAGGR